MTNSKLFATAVFQFLLFCFTPNTEAVDPPLNPILRLNLEGHSAQITQIEPTADKKRLVSVSVDKSIRIWNIDDLSLERVIRLPIAQGFEGALYALAVSPASSIVAVSGLTGYSFEGTVSIYFVDIDAGVVVGRIGGVQEVVTNMRFSSDGSKLYAALSRNQGLRVFDVLNETLIFSDTEYSGNTIGIEFQAEEGYSVSSHDGSIKFYNNNHEIIKIVAFNPEELPTAIRSSTIDNKLAVGFLGVARVAVIDVTDGYKVIDLDSSCFQNQENTPRVFWNAASTRLYAYGNYDGADGAPLYSWSYKNDVFSSCEKFITSRRNLLDIDVLDDNRLLFATSDPSIGVLDISTGAERVTRGSTADFRNASEHFRVSFTGESIVFPVNASGEHLYFSLSKRELHKVNKSFDDALKQLEINPRSTFDSELGSNLPTSKLVVSGETIPLAEYEIANDVFLQSDDIVLVGTEFGLVKFKNAVEVGRVNTVSHVEAINMSGNKELVVILLADGTIRWYSAESLKPILALFANTDDPDNSLEWVAWTDENYYISSTYGDSLIGWQLNNGIEEAADFYTALQYERLLYRPDVVINKFQNATSSQVDQKFVETVDLRTISPGPLSVDLVSKSQRSMVLKIQGSKRELLQEGLAVFNNGIPVLPLEKRVLNSAEGEFFARVVEVPLFDITNQIRVEVTNGSSIGLASVNVKTEKYIKPEKNGDLYVVSIGVNEFTVADDDLVPDLNFAANDAHEILKALINSGTGLYENIHYRELSDYGGELPTKENILNGLKLISESKSQDTVVVFLASHGLSDRKGNYYFFPRDVSNDDVNAIFNEDTNTETLISWKDILEAMNTSSGKRLLIVDTCYARSIEGPQDVQSLSKRSASANFALLSAAQGNEESQEVGRLEHGLFTWAFIEALKTAPDSDGDSFLELNEVFAASIPSVEKYRRADSPQTPQLVSIPALEEIRLSGI